MKMLRPLVALVAVFVAAACSDGPTTAPTGARRSTAPDTTKASTSASDSTANCTPTRDGTGTWGSGNRC